MGYTVSMTERATHEILAALFIAPAVLCAHQASPNMSTAWTELQALTFAMAGHPDMENHSRENWFLEQEVQTQLRMSHPDLPIFEAFVQEAQATHPDFAILRENSMQVDPVKMAAVKQWVEGLEAKFGTTLEMPPLLLKTHIASHLQAKPAAKIQLPTQAVALEKPSKQKPAAGIAS